MSQENSKEISPGLQVHQASETKGDKYGYKETLLGNEEATSAPEKLEVSAGLKVHEAKGAEGDKYGYEQILRGDSETDSVEQAVPPGLKVHLAEEKEGDKYGYGELLRRETDPLLSEVEIRKQLLGESFFDSQVDVETFFDRAHRHELADETSKEILSTLENNYPKYLTLLELEQRYTKYEAELAKDKENLRQKLTVIAEGIDPSTLKEPLPDKAIELLARLEMIEELSDHHQAKVELEDFLEKEFKYVKKERGEKEEVAREVEDSEEVLANEIEIKVKKQIMAELEKLDGLLSREDFLDNSADFAKLLEAVQGEYLARQKVIETGEGNDLRKAKVSLDQLLHLDLLKGEYLTKIVYGYVLADTNLFLEEMSKETNLSVLELKQAMSLPQLDSLEVRLKDDLITFSHLRQPLSRADIRAIWQGVKIMEERRKREEKEKSKLRRLKRFLKWF